MGEATAGGRDRQGSGERDCKDQWMNITTVAAIYPCMAPIRLLNLMLGLRQFCIRMYNSTVVECSPLLID